MPKHSSQVLVIDDDPVIRRLIVTVAREAGYPTSEVANGAEALEMIEKSDFDLLILDLMLPGLSGQEVLERLDPEYGCSVIIVTAGDDHDVVKIDSRMVCAIIRKPFDIHDLRDAITGALEGLDDPEQHPGPRLRVKSSDSAERKSVPPASSRSDDDAERTELAPTDDPPPD